MAKTAVLLVNLGTPDEPTPTSVSRYLREFLMDPLVIDLPWIARWPLIHLLISPFRSRKSARAYQKIWTNQGSPLLFHHLSLGQRLQELLNDDFVIGSAMRYGKPSVAQVLNELFVAQPSRLLVVPLYPQYSLAATESSIQLVKRELTRFPSIPVHFVNSFYAESGFIKAEAACRTHVESDVDFYLFSFHGLPKRQVLSASQSSDCFKSGCCEGMRPANARCYRAQCFETARLIASELGIKSNQFTVSFQSRLGSGWIEPFTDKVFDDLAARGIKRLAVFCPAFVADCLETLEEIQIRGREQFRQAGGEELFLIPSLNQDVRWVEALKNMILKWTGEMTGLK